MEAQSRHEEARGQRPIGILVRLEEKEPDVQIQRHRGQANAPSTYLLQVESPGKGTRVVETFASMPVVVARAAELIRAGYNIGISSPVSLEKH